MLVSMSFEFHHLIVVESRSGYASIVVGWPLVRIALRNWTVATTSPLECKMSNTRLFDFVRTTAPVEKAERCALPKMYLNVGPTADNF
jgi:hypothetical protein